MNAFIQTIVVSVAAALAAGAAVGYANSGALSAAPGDRLCSFAADMCASKDAACQSRNPDESCNYCANARSVQQCTAGGESACTMAVVDGYCGEAIVGRCGAYGFCEQLMKNGNCDGYSCGLETDPR